jgi:hypothetical protein
VAMQVRIGLRLFFFVRPGERHSGLRNHTHTHTHTHTHFPLVPSPPFFYTVVQLV